jgi:predicted nucleic acid-binding Zn finger protein
MIMVEFTVWNLYHESSSLNSELETKEYGRCWRYFGRKTTQILNDGYCSGVEV